MVIALKLNQQSKFYSKVQSLLSCIGCHMQKTGHAYYVTTRKLNAETTSGKQTNRGKMKQHELILASERKVENIRKTRTQTSSWGVHMLTNLPSVIYYYFMIWICYHMSSFLTYLIAILRKISVKFEFF